MAKLRESEDDFGAWRRLVKGERGIMEAGRSGQRRGETAGRRIRSAAGLLAGLLALSAAFCPGGAAGLTAQAAASGVTAGGGTTIYVDAQDGLDSNDGTLEAPVQTLKRAQELVRGLVQDMDGDVTVCLRGGRHTLEETLEFGPEDSGRNGFSVVWTSYEGEEAEVSGGVQITDWTLHDAEKNIWSAPAQGVVTRDFFVDGETAVRARTELEVVNVDSAFKLVMVKKGSLPESFARPEDMDVLYRQNGFRWAIAHVEGVEETKGYPTLKCTEVSFVGMPENKNVKYLENAYELLDEPGEWYLNTEEDRVYYMPKEGQDMNSADALLGRLENLFMLLGTADGPVENITFEGLAFGHTTWLLPLTEYGLHPVQSAVLSYADYKEDESGYVPSPLASTLYYGSRIDKWIPPTSNSIYGQYVGNVRFSGNRFRCLGNGGVHLGRATKNSAIENNSFRELGCGAVVLGGFDFYGGIDHYPQESEEGLKALTENNTVSDNYIRDVCRVNKNGSAIQVGFTARTSIDHNTVIGFPYTGISMGWGWGVQEFGHDEFVLGGNSITNNRLEDGMNSVFDDGGAIYTLGRQDDSVIAGNYIERISDGKGIYLDEGSYGFTITGNVLRDARRNFSFPKSHNYISKNYCAESVAASKGEDDPWVWPAHDRYKDIEGIEDYIFEENDLWDEAAVAAVRAEAGARGSAVPEESGEDKEAQGTEPAGAQDGESAAEPEGTEPESAEPEGTEPGETTQDGEAVQPEESKASGDAEPAGTQPGEPADKEARGGTGGAAAWILLPVLAGVAAAAVVFARKRKK